MNIKSERIEQLIQLVNRNLLLIYSGQADGITPLETRKLERVDTVIFGHDKFAYEMVHFLNAAEEKLSTDKSLFSLWDNNFVRGLENLLIECAVIHDDIERDCFVSRVYCWFTEKISERRDVPRRGNVGVDTLKSSVSKLAGDQSHTFKGLNSYDPSSRIDYREALESRVMDTSTKNDMHDYDTLPAVSSIESHKGSIAKHMPAHVKHNYPGVFVRSKSEPESSFLPKIPGVNENYGMLYNKPETEAEKNMNEMWLARRRQEAYDYKTQQQLAIVMDRLALHKSRMDSEALRRQESDAIMKGHHQRAQSPDDEHRAHVGSRPSSATKPRQRGMMERLLHVDHNMLEYDSPDSSPERRGGKIGLANSRRSKEGGTIVTISGGAAGGPDKEETIPTPARTVVSNKQSKVEHKPMRFKTELPDGYIAKQSLYMQLSDSDDDDPDSKRLPKVGFGSTISKSGAKKKPSGAKQEVLFKREAPLVRERPQSARVFKTVASDDPELKVHYRYTNYRRAPMTTQMESWLANREQERQMKSESMARDLVAAVQAKADKKKGGKEEKGGKKEGKAGKKDGKGRPSSAKGDGEEKPKPRYKSAQDFMNSHFPNFDDDENLQTMAPMRAMQLIEVGEIIDTYHKYGLHAKEAVIRKALVVPVDKPEAIALENLRENSEGLMINPNPKEYWRVFAAGKKGKKGGKKKKK